MRIALIVLTGALLCVNLVPFDLANGLSADDDDDQGSVFTNADSSRDLSGEVRADVPDDLTLTRGAATNFLSRPARGYRRRYRSRYRSGSRLKKLGMMGAVGLGGAYLVRKKFKGRHRLGGGGESYYGPGSYPPYGGGYGGGYGAGYAGGYGGGYPRGGYGRGYDREEMEEWE